jgi:hypothetical protein
MKSRILETIGITIGAIASAIVMWLGFPIQEFLEQLPIHILIRIMVLLLLWLILLLAYVIYLKIKHKLALKFGVLWNRNKEPYCPIHEKPLSRHKTKRGGKVVVGLDCRKCGGGGNPSPNNR